MKESNLSMKESKAFIREQKKKEKLEKKEAKLKVKQEKKEQKLIDKTLKKEMKSNSTPWVKYYPEGASYHLNYPKCTMVGYFLEAVARYPESTCIEYFGRTYTFREFFERIRETAKSLKAQGVKEGDHVAICMPNTPQAVMMFYACNMVGAVAALIHPLSGEKEIQDYINGSDCTFLLIIDLAYEKVHNIVDKTCLKKIVVTSAGDNLTTIKKFLYKFKNRGSVPKIELTDDIMTWGEFLNYGYDYEGEVFSLRTEKDPAVILYSGGTSGDPKGILLSNLNFNALALSSHTAIEQSGPGKTILAILPIFHGFGLGVSIHTCLCCGMKVVLIPTFNPKEFGKMIVKHKANIVTAVPSLYESLTKTKLGKKELACLECAISGGDFMSKDLKEKVDAYLAEHGSSAKVRVGYGLTEASAAVCATPTNEYRENSIGIPFPDAEFKIVKVGTYDEVPVGEVGEICINGPTVMMGYLNNLEETLKTLQVHHDGKTWLHTGDVGSMDKDGFIYFAQRVKRMIISNGYNLYPSYIETILNSHPAVFTSTVIGIPHPKKTQVAKAFIVLNDGYKPSKELERDINAHCEKNLARYSLPSEYEFRDSLPKTLVGKVAYRKLEEEEKEKNNN